MNKTRLNPDVPRAVLQRLVKEARKSSGLTQGEIADAIGERRDTLSKTLNGHPDYDLDTPQLVMILNVIDVGFAEFSRLVIEENRLLSGGLDF